MKTKTQNKNWIKRHPVWTGIIGFFLLIFLVGFVGNTFTPISDNNSSHKVEIQELIEIPEYKIDKMGACYMAQTFVEKRLKAPSSAKFENCYDAVIYYNENKTYEVYSYVDAQNGFGAMIRTEYHVHIREGENDMWYLKDIQIYN